MNQHAPTTPTWLVVDADQSAASSKEVAGAPGPAQSPAEQMAAQEFEIDIGRFFLALWTRKWMIMALTALLFGLAAIVIMSIPPTYQATAQILIDPADELTKVQAVSSPLSTTNQAISSEIEIIQSSDIARQLIAAVDFQSYARAPIPSSKLDTVLGLSPGLAEKLKQLRKQTQGWLSAEADPTVVSDSALMEAYYSSLGVSRVAGTFLISINFQTLDPAFSAEAANQLAAIYIANQIEGKKAARQQASELLSENLAKLETDIRRSNEQVDDYRQESGIDDSPSSELIGQQLTQQTTQLVDARSLAQVLNARLRSMERLRQAGKFEELLSVVNSESAETRWQEVIRVRSALATASQDYGPNHPEIVRQINELQDAMTSLESQLGNAVEATRIEADAATSKVNELESSIIDLRRSMTELKEKENQLNQLKADSDISRTLHELLTSRIREAESAVIEGPDARILNLAEPPLYPSSQPKKILLLAALCAAFTVSSVAALGLEFLNGGYQSEEALSRSLGWPILATVPKKKMKLLSKLRSASKASAYEESFNILLTNLEMHGLDFKSDKAVVVMVTSSIPAEGKSTVVRDLAAVAAGGGNKVLVIDADLRRPTMHKQFDVRRTPGIANCDADLFNGSLMKSLVVHDPESGVDVITAGDNSDVRPQQVLKSAIISQILNSERRNYDLILLDTPPILAVSDALLIGKRCDAAVFVVKWSSTARRLVQRAVIRFSKGGVALAGCVLTQVPKNTHRVGTYQYLDY